MNRFQTLQGLETHIQNGLCLHIVQPEAAHQVFLGVIVAGADDLDNIEPGHVLGADTQAVLTEYGVE